MSIRVLIVDDQAMVRAGFRLFLEAETDFEVVGEAEDGEKAIAAARKLKPDVILMDVQMPVMDGLEATRQLLSSEGETSSRILILTTFERDEYIFEALHSGASGFILKNAPPEDLIHAIRVVAEGNALLAPSVTRRIIEEYRNSGSIDQAIGTALGTTGKAIVFIATTLVCGIVFWFLSKMMFQALMGLLLAIILLFNMLGALLIIPSFIAVFRPGFITARHQGQGCGRDGLME